jgi:hypothetical protein
LEACLLLTGHHITAHVGHRGGNRTAIAAGLGGVVPMVSAIEACEEGVASRDCLLDLDLVVSAVCFMSRSRERRAEDQAALKIHWDV